MWVFFLKWTFIAVHLPDVTTQTKSNVLLIKLDRSLLNDKVRLSSVIKHNRTLKKKFQ